MLQAGEGRRFCCEESVLLRVLNSVSSERRRAAAAANSPSPRNRSSQTLDRRTGPTSRSSSSASTWDRGRAGICIESLPHSSNAPQVYLSQTFVSWRVRGDRSRNSSETDLRQNFPGKIHHQREKGIHTSERVLNSVSSERRRAAAAANSPSPELPREDPSSAREGDSHLRASSELSKF